MSPYMRSIKLCPLSIFVVLVITTHAATEEAQQFFQHDHKAFLCNHSLQMNELKNVQWLINDVVCADIFIEGGVNTTTTWNCGLKTRAEMNISHLVISSLETRDEGEFRCMIKKGYFAAEEVTKFNVTINVRPTNHTLSLGDKTSSTSSCDTVAPVLDTSELSCSVDSKPPANITWSTTQDLSLQNVTVCNQRSDKVYHCINTLTLPKENVPTTGSLDITCHVQVQDDTSDRCIRLVPPLVRCNSTSCKNGGTCDESTGCKCADNWYGTYCTQECHLITSVPVFYNVTLGGNHTFECNASGGVSWKRKEEIHPGRTLALVNVRQIQEGYYYCHATSSVCTQSVRFKLTVLHYWETDGIKKFESDGIEVKPGKSVVVNCSVTGQPVPNVQWSRLIDDDSSNPSLGNASVGWSLLELHSFQADDAGQYVCSASYLDFHTNWTISIKLVDDGSGLQTWVIVVIVVLCVVLLGVLVLFLLLKLLLNKSPEKAIGPFGSQTKLIVVGLLVVILLPGIGLALVISYYLVKVTESSNGEEPKRERTPSNATASKVHPEMTGNEEQVMSNNGTKGGAVTPALSAVSGTPLALSATVTQTHGGAPVKLEPLAPTETTDVVDVQEEKKKKKKKKKKKHRKHKDEENVYNEIEDATAETTLVSGEPEEK